MGQRQIDFNKCPGDLSLLFILSYLASLVVYQCIFEL